MTIIPLPTTRVVIRSARVMETCRRSANGVVTFRHDPPIETFFVDYEEGDGTLTVWDGPHYGDAIAAAREWSDDGTAFLDLTNEIWGRA